MNKILIFITALILGYIYYTKTVEGFQSTKCFSCEAQGYNNTKCFSCEQQMSRVPHGNKCLSCET